MNTIIISTDFSPEAENAMMYVADACREQGYTLVIFSLQNMSIHALNGRVPSRSIDEMIAMRQQQINDVAAAVKNTKGINVIPHLATGDFYDELKHCIELHSAQLVVMGMAEQSLEQDLLGNTTTSALHRLKFPLLAVPLTARYKGISKILFACDIVRGFHAQLLEQVKTMATNLKAEVEVFHVSEKVEELSELVKADENQGMIRENFTGIHYHYKDVRSNEVIKAIRDEIELTEPDILIMIPYRYGFWNSMVHRSKTRVMASGLSIPLLSIPL